MGNIFREEFGYNKWLNKDRFKIRTSLSKNSRVIHQRNNFKTMFLSEIFSKPDKALFLIRVFKSYAIVNPKDETKFLFKINKLNQSFYFEYLKVDKKNFRKLFNSVWVYIWNGIRYWLLPVVVFSVIFYGLCIIRATPFNKSLFGWLALAMLFYWLISGFVFFIKKYQFGKYTSVIQRFWRRSYILFWVLEACLFVVFMYLSLNASAETFFVTDEIQIFKNKLFSWRFFLVKLLPCTFILVVGYIQLIYLKNTVFSKTTATMLLITMSLSYIVWLEFYQFYHVMNYHGNLNWVYEPDERMWNLELEPRKSRIANNYVTILIILKFWHIIFIYLFWIFLLLRSYELNRIRYPLLSANLQNFSILYIFCWVLMFPWVKYHLRKLIDNPYYWFYNNTHSISYRIFFNDIVLISYNLSNVFQNFNLFFFENLTFYYWQTYNEDFHFDGYRKHYIRNQVLTCLKT
jgi:hypothetical protein